VAAKARPLDAFKNTEGQEGLGEDWKKLPKMEGKTVKPKVRGVPKDLDWFVPEALTGYSEMGNPSNTAQVHPYLFTTSMAELAQEKGVDIKTGCHVDSIDYTGGHVKTVTYTDKATKTTHTIAATDAILAAGPWTKHIFPVAPIGAIRSHSVTIKADVSPYIIFTEIDLPPNFRTEKTASKRGKRVSPEIFGRPNGEIYVCGMFCDSFRSLSDYSTISSTMKRNLDTNLTTPQAKATPPSPSPPQRSMSNATKAAAKTSSTTYPRSATLYTTVKCSSNRRVTCRQSPVAEVR
jgi:glycine/D-amino acid oxidase-like deaminating enzyme